MKDDARLQVELDAARSVIAVSNKVVAAQEQRIGDLETALNVALDVIKRLRSEAGAPALTIVSADPAARTITAGITAEGDLDSMVIVPAATSQPEPIEATAASLTPVPKARKRA